jgi:hypothetical protein
MAELCAKQEKLFCKLQFDDAMEIFRLPRNRVRSFGPVNKNTFIKIINLVKKPVLISKEQTCDLRTCRTSKQFSSVVFPLSTMHTLSIA